MKPNPTIIQIEDSLFNNSSKTIDKKMVKTEKAILTIFGLKKASDLGINLKKIENLKEDIKRTIFKNINAFKKERLVKPNDNLILANGKYNNLLK